LALTLVQDAFEPEKHEVQISGYCYSVDLGEEAVPRWHSLSGDGFCTCFLGERCPAVDLLQEYLAAGGERAPVPPLGFFPSAPAFCPLCGAQAEPDPTLNSKRRGSGWRCREGGTSHYWQFFGLVLKEKFAANPWLFPPVVIRNRKRAVAWDGLQPDDEVLYPGLQRSQVV